MEVTKLKVFVSSAQKLKMLLKLSLNLEYEVFF